MSHSADTITLTHAELAQIIANAVAAAMGTKRAMTPAEKQRAYRDRQKTVTAVTGKVTPEGETVTSVTEKVTPPSPPPLPPTPPIPAPTPEGDTRACEALEISDFEVPNPKRFPLPPAVAAGIQALHRRRPATPWNPKELKAARLLTRIPEAQLLADLGLFAKARAAGFQFYRRDVLTLLNNWQGEVERSQDFLQTITTPKNGNDSRAGRPPVSRNVEPLPADRPSLNATAINAPGRSSDLGALGRPCPSGDGKSLW